MDSVVVVIPTQFRVQPLAECGHPVVPVLFAPRGEALQGAPEFLAGRPPLEGIFPLAGLAPPKLTPQQLAAGFACLAVPTARHAPWLGARQCQAALLSPLPQHVVEAFRVCLFCKRTHAVVRVAAETCCPSTGLFDHFFAPYVQHVVQAHLGEYG